LYFASRCSFFVFISVYFIFLSGPPLAAVRWREEADLWMNFREGSILDDVCHESLELAGTVHTGDCLLR